MSEQPETPRESFSYRSVIGVAVVVLLGLIATAGVKSYRDLATARAHEADLEARIAASQERWLILSEHLERIETDPLTLEGLARERLGMVEPGDVVFVLPEDDPSPVGPPPAPP